MFVPIHTPEISPRAEELARRINEAITAYRATHPDLSGVELQQALMRAAMSAGTGASGAGAPRVATMLVAGALGIFVALGLALYLGMRGGDGGGAGGSSWPAIAGVIVIVALAVVFITIRRSSS